MTRIQVQFSVSKVLIVMYTGAVGSLPLSSQPPRPSSQSNANILGTWKGDSICVGSNRPACKNEVVVYRFEEISGKPGKAMMFADKIVGGKREPMGKLECSVTGGSDVSCEFNINQTHGLWHYTLQGQSLDGTLVLLPRKELIRTVNTRRANEADLPAAPAKSDYE